MAGGGGMLSVHGIDLHYGAALALRGVSLEVPGGAVAAQALL